MLNHSTYKGLTMHIATYTYVKNNPRYGPLKLNPGLPFSIAIKNLYSAYFPCTSCSPLYMVAHLYLKKVHLATIQDLTEVSGYSLANG